MQNSTSKSIGIIIVILIIIAGIWLMTRSSTPSAIAPTTSTSGVVAGNETPAPASVGNGDAALAQDAASIDSQMSGLNADAAAAQQ